ncbi:hypothetical protein J5491_03510 [Candidatus Saccharibacteria bacterium]|nr:hypothetical protein [Candidatus Saccharibacteria bacterium]
MRKTMLLGDTKFTNRDRAKLGKRERRISNLLNDFRKEGGYHVELGFFRPAYQFNYHTHEHEVENYGDRFGFVIRDGHVTYSDPYCDLTDILNAAGVEDSLPVFNGEELDYYTLNDDGTEWRRVDKSDEEGYFYITYYSVD